MRLNPASLRRYRRESRLSITELCDVAQEYLPEGTTLTRSHLSNIENGHRPASPGAIVALAAALKVSPYALLGPEDPKRAIKEMVEQLGLTVEDLFPADDEEPVAS